MKMLAGLWAGFVGLSAAATLVACSPEKQEHRGAARSQTAAFTEKFLQLQSKSEAPRNLPAGETIQIDEAGRLLYRNNLNKYCFVSALGTLVNVRRTETNHLVTYKYYKVANSAEETECQASDAQCFAEIADCRKVTLVVTDNLLMTFKATLPLDLKDRGELMKLSPYRFK